jgi:hypothetical protein
MLIIAAIRRDDDANHYATIDLMPSLRDSMRCVIPRFNARRRSAFNATRRSVIQCNASFGDSTFMPRFNVLRYSVIAVCGGGAKTDIWIVWRIAP